MFLKTMLLWLAFTIFTEEGLSIFTERVLHKIRNIIKSLLPGPCPTNLTGRIFNVKTIWPVLFELSLGLSVLV